MPTKMLRTFGLVAIGLVVPLAVVLWLGVDVCTHRAEQGKMTFLPKAVREEFAEELYKKAAKERDEREQARLFRAVVNLNPQHVFAWSYLCGTYRKMKQWQLAADACQSDVKLYPSANGYYSLGLALEHSKDYAGAADAYGRAQELFPDNVAYGARSLLMLLAAGRYEQAVKVAKQNLELDRRLQFPEEELGTQVQLGFAYSRLGDEQEARDAFTRVFPVPSAVSCSLGEKHHGRVALECSGPDRPLPTAHRVQRCIGFGCLEQAPPGMPAEDDGM